MLGRLTLGVDPALVATRVAVPTSATSAGTAGTWAMDATHYYVCVATDTWRRVEVVSW
jgi:hypothetical protein